jgi:hypothetical protein
MPDEPKASFFRNFLDSVGKKTFAIIIATVFIIASVLTFLSLRETRLIVNIKTPDLQLLPDAYVVMDFSERIAQIKRNLADRRRPIQQILDDNQSSLAASEADMAGKEQRKKMLIANMEKDQAEIPEMVKKTDGELNKLWDEESSSLNEDENKYVSNIEDQIKKRADELHLNFKLDTDVNSPEVYVNAFRLALYGAPAKINPTQQQEWAEGLLTGWRNQEKLWDKKREEIKKKASELRAPIGDIIDQVDKRGTFLKQQIAEVNDAESLIQQDIDKYEARTQDLNRSIQTLIQPFYEELIKVPAGYAKTTLPVNSNATIDARELNRNPNLKPGRYKLLVRGLKNDEEYWAFVDFDLKKFQTTRLNLTDSDFVPARSLIE